MREIVEAVGLAFVVAGIALIWGPGYALLVIGICLIAWVHRTPGPPAGPRPPNGPDLPGRHTP
jgi:hypothetical protein